MDKKLCELIGVDCATCPFGMLETGLECPTFPHLGNALDELTELSNRTEKVVAIMYNIINR